MVFLVKSHAGHMPMIEVKISDIDSFEFWKTELYAKYIKDG